jgi:hypothetical protein
MAYAFVPAVFFAGNKTENVNELLGQAYPMIHVGLEGIFLRCG